MCSLQFTSPKVNITTRYLKHISQYQRPHVLNNMICLRSSDHISTSPFCFVDLGIIFEYNILSCNIIQTSFFYYYYLLISSVLSICVCIFSHCYSMQNMTYECVYIYIYFFPSDRPNITISYFGHVH